MNPLRWLVAMLDFRLYQTGGDTLNGGPRGPQRTRHVTGAPGEEGEYTLHYYDEGPARPWGGLFGLMGTVAQAAQPAAPAPTPAPEPAGPFVQTANIDRTSRFESEQYSGALEGIYEKSRGAGATFGPGAMDYELPDIAFGTRLY